VVTDAAKHRDRISSEPLRLRLSTEAPADLDERLGRIKPLSAKVRVPIVAFVIFALWAAVIAACIGLFSR
jgi:hypothetical protein